MARPEIVAPDPGKQRIVNSIMLAVGTKEMVLPDQQKQFIATDTINQKTY